MVPPAAVSSTIQVASAELPSIVNTNCRAPLGPSVSDVGDTEAIPEAAELTLNLRKFDTESGVSPAASQISTCTFAVTGAFNSAAGTNATRRVLLAELIAKLVSLPFADHTTTLDL